MRGVGVYGRGYWECVPNGERYVFCLSNICNGVKHMFCVPYFLTVPIGQTKLRTCYGIDEKIQWSMGVVGVYGRGYWECVPNGERYVFCLSNISNGVKHMFCVPYFLTVPIGQTKLCTCYGIDEKIQ